MNKKNQNILDAAMALFSRYGVGKTTMNDIAKEAGVARQTVYNAFPGKEAILRAVVFNLAEQTCEKVVLEWRSASGAEEKLNVFFELGPLYWYDLTQKFPDITEILDGLHDAAREELQDAQDRWVSIFANEFSEYIPAAGIGGKSRESIAEFIYSASISIKHAVNSRQELEDRLDVLKLSVLALLQPK